MITATNVKQTSTTTGTGNLTMAAAPTGFRNFDAVMTLGSVAGTSGEDWAPYYAENSDGSEWEFGIARVIDDTLEGQLARSTAVILESSNSDALVNFSGDTTIRLVTPPDIRGYERGVKVTLTATESYSSGSTIDWDAETNDTDDCWAIGDPSAIVIPAWAEEVEITGFFEDDSGPTDKTISSYVSLETLLTEHRSATRDEFGQPLICFNDTGTVWRAWLQCTVTVDRANIDINTLAELSFKAYSNDTSSHSLSTDTFVLVRVIR